MAVKTVEVVAALIIRGGRFLAAQRGPAQSHAGCWEFPGGKVEPGETHEEALTREIMEEMGVRVHVDGFVEMRVTEMPGKCIHVHLYRTMLESDAFCDAEHSALEWITAAQARERTWTQADLAFLEDVDRAVSAVPSVFEAMPCDFDKMRARAGGEHVFRAVQRPWDTEKPGHSLGHTVRMLMETRFDCREIKLVDEICAEDGTKRLFWELIDGHRIETVYMPRDVKVPRVTLCLSSQVGCAMNCAFCATATLGLRRSLTAGEIVQEAVQTLKLFGPHRAHEVNLVFMGMGEALMNTENVLRAIEVMACESGLNIAAVRMTLSTCGVLSSLDALKNARVRPNLAVSINAVRDDLRSKIMPINRKFPLSDLREALLAWPYRTHEKILLEYVLLAGVNDSSDDAALLAAFARDIPHNINIIPYNETPRDTFHAPSADEVKRFAAALRAAGCFVTIRAARGAEVGGACGQLLAKKLTDNP